LTNSGIISPFDKNSNFDRLFPNQASHSGKGFGNLIALPLQKIALEKANTCFIDPKRTLPGSMGLPQGSSKGIARKTG